MRPASRQRELDGSLDFAYSGHPLSVRIAWEGRLRWWAEVTAVAPGRWRSCASHRRRRRSSHAAATLGPSLGLAVGRHSPSSQLSKGYRVLVRHY
jgi:hypothetical protein